MPEGTDGRIVRLGGAGVNWKVEASAEEVGILLQGWRFPEAFHIGQTLEVGQPVHQSQPPGKATPCGRVIC